MNYDCIIIGGGLAGMTCGLRCVAAGLKTVVISAGMSALHFASGSIDLLGRFPDDTIVKNPFEQLQDFIRLFPEHPYSKCGEETISKSLSFFTEQLNRQSVTLCSNYPNNHFHLTTYGTLTPTYLSQQSVYSPELERAFFEEDHMALISFEGFRDFHIPLVAANLPKQALFRDHRFTTGVVDLSPLIKSGKNPHEFRSIDICRMFEDQTNLQKIARNIRQLAADARIVGIPACIGFIRHNEVFNRLKELTGRLVYEIPTLPPSILGMRLDQALKSRFSAMGGVMIAGDKVTGGEFSAGRLAGIKTGNHPSDLMEANTFVLASGSFFSNGLVSESSGMSEPVFNLALSYEKDRKNWASDLFFQPESHAFLDFGVKTNERLNPSNNAGHVIENLYCAGAILAGYNPIREGSGGGVAIATGYSAAEQVIASNFPSGAEQA